jgi:hypothetical protein
MTAINYVARTATGSVSRDQVVDGSNVSTIWAGGEQEISFNLRQMDIRSYVRDGQNLEMTLADGRVVILENYFGQDGEPDSRLFLSADGYLNEVELVEGGEGVYFAQYGPTEQWGKWSPSDELIFLDGGDAMLASGAGVDGDGEVSMLAAGLLGGSSLLGLAGAGAAGLAATALIAGDGESDGSQPYIAPGIDQTDPIDIGGDGAGPDTTPIIITGTAQPGSNVTVEIGDETVTAETGEDGSWEAEFGGDDFPEDGAHDVTATVTEPGGDVIDLTGPPVTIDTTPPDTSVLQGTVETGDIVNAEEYEAGIDITGTGETGSSIKVTIDDVTHETAVDENGEWIVTFEPGELETGEYTTEVTVVASDPAGNTVELVEDIRIDTVPNPLEINTGATGGDGVVNSEESAAGFDVTGTTAPGAEVTLTLGEITKIVTANIDGEWVATFAPGELATGTYTADVTATTTDAAGNVATTMGTFEVDTEVLGYAMQAAPGGTDGVINSEEIGAGFAVTGTTEPGSSVVLTLGDATVDAVVDASGNWTAQFTEAQIGVGTFTETLTAVTTDAAGNSETLSQTVEVDTEAGALAIDTGAVATDGTVNLAEAEAGFDLTGSADPGAEVTLTLGEITRTVTADASGTWRVPFDPGELATGTYTADVTATTTDAAGNVATTMGTFEVDTEVLGYAMQAAPGGTDGVINSEEIGAGFAVTGTTEPGSSVVLTLGDATVDAVVDASGNWTAQFTEAQIGAGTFTETLTAVTTDAAGNSETLSQKVEVDTEAGALTLNAADIGGDGTVNLAEAEAGVVVTGTADPGALVEVTLGEVTQSTVTDSGGNWRTTYRLEDIPGGDYMSDVVATTTDAAGNVARVDAQVHVDTQVDNLSLNDLNIAIGSTGEQVINADIAAAGFPVTGTIEPGSSVIVTIAGVSHTATVNPDGSWVAQFQPNEITGTEYIADMKVDVVDPAGNPASIEGQVPVDLLVNELSRDPGPVAGDDVVNALEAADGVTLTGQVEAGSTVMIDAFGKSYPATVDAAGNWSLTLPGADIPLADDTFPVVVTATDIAGNSSEIRDSLTVDTMTPDSPDLVGYFREGGGYRNVTLETTGDDVEIHQVAPGGGVSTLSLAENENTFLGETDYFFTDAGGTSTSIPDGSQLVVTSSDDAGNTASTYVVLDETSTNAVDAGNPNLSQFQIETIDLRFGDRSELTITEDQLVALSDTSDQLVVRGGSDDTVTVTGAQRAGSTQMHGERFDIYTLGDDATVVVDDDIDVVT